jgi:hypothetical protein
MSIGAGLLQLICTENTDEYLCEKENSFKYSYDKINKFSKINYRVDFENLPVLYSNDTTEKIFYSNNLANKGDLLEKLYFCCTLPEIYASNSLKFRWVKKIGLKIIKSIEFQIGATTVQKFTNHWLNIVEELLNDNCGYNKMIGNVEELTNPHLTNNKKIVISNNRFNFYYYPNSDREENIPSIRKYDLRIPLPFWFSKDVTMALPILLFQNNPIKIKIILEDSEKLYQVYSEKLNRYISPRLYNDLERINNSQHNDITLSNFLKETNSNNVIDIKSHLLTTNIYLDREQYRNYKKKVMHEYLFDDIIEFNDDLRLNNNEQTITLNVISKPLKEIFWVIYRDNNDHTNEHFNYTASISEQDNYDILEHATYKIANEYLIFEEIDNNYFDNIQPHEYHSNIPRNKGIYMYSFSLNPEGKDSSGHFNAVVDNKLKLKIKTYKDEDGNYNLQKIVDQKIENNDLNLGVLKYKIKIFLVCHNFLNITNGTANLKLI